MKRKARILWLRFAAWCGSVSARRSLGQLRRVRKSIIVQPASRDSAAAVVINNEVAR